MARKPNYGLQRSDINRSKQQKQEAKQREREEAVARRKAGRDGSPLPDVDAPEGDSGVSATAAEHPKQD